jgi:hypothetical protein
MPTWTSVADGAIVPVVELPPAAPFTSHVTVVFVVVEELESFTVATNCVVLFTGTLAVVGVIETDVIVVTPPLPPPHAASAKSEAAAATIEK